MKEMGLSRLKSTSPGWPRLAFEWPSSQVDHHCRGTARVTVTCPLDDVH